MSILQLLYYQDTEHHNFDTSTHATLPSTEARMANTILEEEIGVGTSPFSIEHNLEVDSPYQQLNVHVENSGDNPSQAINVSPKAATPTKISHSTGMSMSMEEFEKLEKIGPFEVFDLIIKGGVLLSKTTEG